MNPIKSLSTFHGHDNLFFDYSNYYGLITEPRLNVNFFVWEYLKRFSVEVSRNTSLSEFIFPVCDIEFYESKWGDIYMGKIDFEFVKFIRIPWNFSWPSLSTGLTSLSFIYYSICYALRSIMLKIFLASGATSLNNIIVSTATFGMYFTLLHY